MIFLPNISAIVIEHCYQQNIVICYWAVERSSRLNPILTDKDESKLFSRVIKVIHDHHVGLNADWEVSPRLFWQTASAGERSSGKNEGLAHFSHERQSWGHQGYSLLRRRMRWLNGRRQPEEVNLPYHAGLGPPPSLPLQEGDSSHEVIFEWIILRSKWFERSSPNSCVRKNLRNIFYKI